MTYTTRLRSGLTVAGRPDDPRAADNPLSQQTQLRQANETLNNLFSIPGFQDLPEDLQVHVLERCAYCYTLGIIDGMVAEVRKRLT